LITAVQNRVRRVRDLETPIAGAGEQDEATGLLRRQVLLDRVDAALGAGAEALDSGGALYLEVEGTALLRERFGLAALEHVLVEAGRLLAGALGDRAIAARVQDKAFLVLAPGLDDDALDVLAGQLRDGVMQHAYEAGGKTLQLRVAVGICALRFGFNDANALLDIAERICRDARVSDGGIKRYVSARASELRHEAAQVERLREAIGHDALGLIYQPIVAVQGGQDAQFQTLLRMRDADGHLLAAADILPVAERGKLMIDVDRWVLTRAMDVVRRQRNSGHAVTLFVPQAMTTFTAPGQVEWLKSALSALEVAGPSLVLESRLEDALFNPSALQRFTDSMREDGVRMCVGQYEHAADANRLLEQLRPEFIKVAYKYVAPNAPQEARNELRGLIEGAHRLGIEVIGPRVEEARSAATLWMSGIDFVQGNLVQGAGESLDFDFSAAVV
jgi:EAL domain-containing protein (putative c-di-GMP-specific phosphodiesterase class I)/GGDEF domain-containing protein